MDFYLVDMGVNRRYLVSNIFWRNPFTKFLRISDIDGIQVPMGSNSRKKRTGNIKYRLFNFKDYETIEDAEHAAESFHALYHYRESYRLKMSGNLCRIALRIMDDSEDPQHPGYVNTKNYLWVTAPTGHRVLTDLWMYDVVKESRLFFESKNHFRQYCRISSSTLDRDILSQDRLYPEDEKWTSSRTINPTSMAPMASDDNSIDALWSLYNTFSNSTHPRFYRVFRCHLLTCLHAFLLNQHNLIQSFPPDFMRFLQQYLPFRKTLLSGPSLQFNACPAVADGTRTSEVMDSRAENLVHDPEYFDMLNRHQHFRFALPTNLWPHSTPITYDDYIATVCQQPHLSPANIPYPPGVIYYNRPSSVRKPYFAAKCHRPTSSISRLFRFSVTDSSPVLHAMVNAVRSRQISIAKLMELGDPSALEPSVIDIKRVYEDVEAACSHDKW